MVKLLLPIISFRSLTGNGLRAKNKAMAAVQEPSRYKHPEISLAEGRRHFSNFNVPGEEFFRNKNRKVTDNSAFLTHKSCRNCKTLNSLS